VNLKHRFICLETAVTKEGERPPDGNHVDHRTCYPVRPLPVEGACRYLPCSDDLLEELISLGHFRVIRLGSEPGQGKRDRRKRWVDRHDLDDFIEKRKAERFESATLKHGKLNRRNRAG